MSVRLALLILSLILVANGCKSHHMVLDRPTVQRITTVPVSPKPGERVTFRARIYNGGTEDIPLGTPFRVAFSVDGQVLGSVDCQSPDVIPGGLFDVTTKSEALNNTVGWQATTGRHFVVAAIARQSDHFDDADVITDSENSALMRIGPPPAARPVRIMPLGDSVTGGSKSTTSYRYFLSKALRKSGYNDIAFVGSLHGVTDSNGPPDANWDADHEGHPGWTAEQIVVGTSSTRDWAAGKLSGSGGWARVYQPDIALIDLGLNDLSYGRSPRDAAESIGKVIDTLRKANPHVAIALAAVTPEWNNEPGSKLIPQLNDRIRVLALRKTTLASPIVLVDLYTGIDVVNDLVDGVHPNDQGHQKLADRWLPVVENLVARARTQISEVDPDIDIPPGT